ncbi:amino acid adenylation domain-containing protein [Corallococcus praedator]|uniref:Amino acid adenylation domain-containing protein n=1 Tax=Corallococcus praedator TaxID=2316724 RepID=A0ABX9QQZ0_9BACT|nr:MULTISPECIES: non-ribosomal peptide synthase/polyketide synthase [Corallococcus]RKH35463.1 amino acid adenylation domain-containing protein [Corallococcus sp. CA031C]RKI17210.1 amino acid adenylation domain-containing protein [Corallococcus praedator]
MAPLSARTSPAATLLELLETRAHALGERPLYTFLEDGGDDEVLSHAGLDLRARRIGAALQSLAKAGERAVLLYPPGLEYVAGFFGCLYAGLVAVPAYPPDPTRLDRTLPRLRAIIRDARASVVLTTSFIQEMGEGLFEGAPELAALRWVATDALPEGTEAGWRRPAPTSDTLAFLQYTSGSTGDPKGVQLSHGNLLHNLGLISHAFEVRSDSVGVIWLPPYHDMGLIGGVLQPLYAGFPVALLSPLAFLRRPRFWLESLSRFGGTISGGPCFAFDLCVRKVPPAEREGLDLRRWELAFCGAEPIRPEVMTRFAEAFAPSGFQGQAFYPCYGLAEGTLIASGGRKGEGVLTRTWDSAALERNEALEAPEGSGARPLVGCGRTLPDQTLLVVDPETRRPCPPERVGEIWVSGPSVAQGYWERPEESEAAFGARLADSEDGRRFLRTGDLGLMRDGELFVAGRRKDLVILRGRNLHPQDLELTLERSHPALRPGCGAAFSIEVGGEERLAVMYEVDPRKPWTADDVVGAVRRGLSEAHEVQLHTLVLIEPGALPKTSSGKIQRRACRAELLAGTARALLTWREADAEVSLGEGSAPVVAAEPVTVEELETWLLARIASRLRVRPETLARDMPITSFGLDSLGAVELANDVESLGTVLRMEVLLQGPTVAQLARTVFAARGEATGTGLIRAEEGKPAPLSSAQQRLWLFEQLERGSPAYHLPAAVRLTGALDDVALERAFAALVLRHEALRATFREEDGTPWQVTASEPASSFRRVDLRELPVGDREAAALLLAREEARASFDLVRGPLFRVTLSQLEAREHLLVVVMHHIASDGASFGILARELSALYGGGTSLAPLSFQYPDFARWRRERETDSALAASLDGWKARLAGVPVALELPTDRPRPPTPSYRGGRVALNLPESLTARLEELGRSEGATLFMTLLAAFEVLLARHSGQEDFCVGTPVNGRERAGLEGLIGCFLDLVVLRASLSGASSFREVLGRTRKVALDAFAHRDVPFERLVEALQPARDRTRAPLFQVLFVLQPEPGAGLALPGLDARRVDIDPGATPYDLTLSLAQGAQGLDGWLEYATDLFDADTAARLVARLRVLLESIVADPDQRLSSLALLPDPERRQVLLDWNDTRTDFPDACLHTLIEAQAARTPEAVAVVCGDEVLTYRALDRRANAVAWRLREQGVGPECIVGFCADRSAELVVGLLGILKAGGAYLPLDPSYPEARLALMLEDSGASVVLAHRHLAGALPFGGRTVVLLDAPGEAEAVPSCDVGPDNLAYVLYTSGSTGRPKGVLIPHRNVASFFTGMDTRVGAMPGTWLAVTSVSFDISVLELLWTLARGFKVVVQGEQGSLGAAPRRATRSRRKPLGFSLFYFAADEGDSGAERYRLLLESARFADRHGFEAVWTPERHFHSFGGLYPNPSLTGAALAAITERVAIRAGSVVLPLHHPVRVAEEWSLVDNISRGRVGISVAPGWNADDFVLAPARYADRREQSRQDLDTVRRLWRGEALSLPNGTGNPVEIRIRPTPVQRELPVWLTAAGNPDTFREAGQLGAGVLTHLLGQRWEELKERIALYREAWREAGHEGEGHVTLMLHTFVGHDLERVRETVEGPLRRYLSTSADLMRGLGRTLGLDLDPASVPPADLEALVGRAFGRFFEGAGLFGTPRTCREQVARIESLGVDEVACLIDFGVDTDAVLASLPALDAVRQRSERDFLLQAQDGGTVTAQLERHGVTHLQCTPSLAQALLLEPGAPGALAGLERLMVGGEALPPELAARLRDTVGGALINMYGPTETTIWSSTHRVDGAPGPVPIGTPIANTSLYVLDAALLPAPIGVPGELFIGGAGVARGYHARPELTAERFLPDPFGGHPGARMYRTGDRARWRSDGTVEFLGRVDHQLKVRGFRVEPGEIESALVRHPGVAQAVVVAREDVPGSARLVAYVVPGPDAALSVEALRAFARRSLPEHLVPSAVVVLEALPLTPNGKVDRKALPAPEGARDVAREYVAPRTETERRVAELWASLLGVERVGVEDDFFALGGHSLLATRAASRIRESFGVDLLLRELFESATPAALAARLDSLPRVMSRVPPLVPRAHEGSLPLSFAQQRLWFLEQLEPGGAAYNDAVAVRVEGSLDAQVLERCLREVVRRHGVLRATFRDEDGIPSWRIAPDARLSLTRVDLSAIAGSARADALSRRTREEALRSFDLGSGPPLRATLIHLEAREHVLLLVLHHLVTDGASLGVLVREVAALYRAFSEGKGSPLTELPLQYVDYAAWQRAWLRGETLEAQLSYWRARLAGAPRALELPTDHPRPAVRSSRGANRSVLLGAELSRGLKALAQREGATPFMVLLAGFSALLSREGGQDDLCVGTPVAGRDRTELEGLIGCFVNTLVLRVSLAGEPSFRELIARARETVLGAFAHQDAPFEELVKALQPERDLGRSPLFQAMLVLQEDPLPEIAMPGLRLRVLEQESHTAKFDLRLILTDTAEGFVANLELSTDLFEPATASRLLGHLRVLLDAGVHDPEQRVRDLALMPPEEQHRILVEWNDTVRPRAEGDVLHRLIEAQADRTPDAVAVSFEGEALTYRELDRRANQLAHHLRTLGVGPDRLVALCLERSLEMVVGLLGILKAGGAYVPLDPEYPRERLEYMLADAAAPVLLTQARLAAGLPHGGAAVVCLDSDWEAVAREGAERLDVAVEGRGLAYVIYTSGSTGRPKGAMNTHAAICNRLHWMQEAYGLDASDRVLQKTPFSFDVSVWEFFWPLMTGARLVLARPGGHREPAYLTDTINHERITTLHFVPSMLRPFLEEPSLAESCASLRRVFCSGEALAPDLRDRFFACVGAELHNLYGPTEAAVDVTAWTCVREDRRPLVPIGRPIANARMYVLDARLRPVPTGVPGELFIGGTPLARGYWQRPELTAERFIPDAYASMPGARLYRTGDKARFLADGSIEYLGRLDDQVKVRGFRIELGEIEAVLSQHPAVRAAAVSMREDIPGDRRLVAYVVSSEVPASELRAFLVERLPEHMVPSAFVTLEALPLSPSGKLDRRALPAPERGPLAGGEDFVEPRSELEHQLARIWASVLGVERVGANDRFFELGGDSILALQVIARARQAGIHLTARQLFQSPTVAGLAQVAVSARRAGEQGPVVGPVPITPIQRWFLERELPEAHHFNQALLLETREPVDAEVLARALRALVDHHDALRMRLTLGVAGWEQSCAEPGREVPLRQVDLSMLLESEHAVAMERIATEAQAGLDLGEGRLVRAVLFDRGAGLTGRLLLVIHHLAVDGVSWRVLLEDLDTALRQLGGRGSVALPAKTTSFQAWAQRLEAHAASSALAEELSFWREELGADVPLLPRDLPDGVNTQESERTVTVALEPAVTRALLRASASGPRPGVEDALLAGVARALAWWTGGRRLRIDVEAHGREELFEDVDLSRTVGWFTALYPVRLELPEGSESVAVLERVRAARERRVGRGLGFGLLRYLRHGDDAAPLRDARASSEVLFNYLGQLDSGTRDTALFTLASGSTGASQGTRGLRSHVLEVVARLIGGRLELTWHYSEALHARGTVETLAQDCVRALTELAELGEERYPLSPLQHGLLFQVLLEPGTDAYFEQLSWTLAGPLDTDALRNAWDAVIERHPALRTSFLWEGVEEPLQVIHSRAEVPWSVDDWRGLSSEDQSRAMALFLRQDRAQGFELSRAPLMRLALVRLGNDVWRCVWSFHHLLLDGWSLARVLGEVLDVYAVNSRGGTWRPPAVADFRAYFEWRGRRSPEQEASFWREQLAGIDAPTPLPAEGGSANERDPGEHELALSEAETTALQDFTRRHRLTPSTLVHGAWALLLSRYGGGEDAVFGTTLAGRPAEVPGIEEAVGLFIHSLPVRTRVRPAVGLLPWLRELQSVLVELNQREPVPLTRLQGWSEVPRGTPLFESLLVFENYPVDAALSRGVAGLEVRDVTVFERTHYPLTAVALPGRSLRLKLQYRPERIRGDAAARLLSHWRTLLQEMIARPEQRLGDVSLLSQVERHRVLVEWNATATAYPREATVHGLFEAQAARTPDALAVVYGGSSLTYAGLDSRANQVAHRLLALGVRRGSTVGLCVERSVELVVGMLGILKAGATYVPLDPAYPRERLAWMLADAGAQVLLTQEGLREVLPTEGVRVLALDGEPALEGTPAKAVTTSGAGPDDAAYVIYTSGSTGTPKGVCVSHQAVVRLVVETDFIHVVPEDRVAQASNASFDAATFEIWGALLNGARVVGVDRETALAPRAFATWLKDEGIRVLFLTTAWFNQVAAEAPDAFRGLRQLHFGGEAVDPRPVRQVLRDGPPERLLHVYGPTESTTFSTWHLVTKVAEGAASIPIGRPLANTVQYVLDGSMAPVPPGGVGELWLGGDGLARGYLGRPELTAERFVPHPFSTRPGARLYKTGDRVRLLDDGSVMFVGRADTQVKVRGFRVEPAEIEAVLLRHPSVRQAAVLAREDSVGGSRRLVAYVVASADDAPVTSLLRAFLGVHLPAYMVPSAFMVLERLPLTPNGKVDRRALPDPTGSEFANDPTVDFIAPRDPEEEWVAGLLSELLGVSRVGAHDSFFDLGGHSLLATRVVARIHAHFGVSLSLRELFDDPTVARLAERIRVARRSIGSERPPPIVRVPRNGPLPLSAMQERLWLLEQLQPGTALYNVPWAAWLTGALDVSAMEQALFDLVLRHEALRTTFSSHAGEPVQVIHPSVALSLPVVDLRGLPETERDAQALRAASEELRRPFDLAHGPLIRALLVRTDERAHLLVLTLHHIISDGWSLGVAVRELSTLYGARLRGLASPFPEPTLQPVDHAVWQREWLQGEALTAQVGYWRKQLAGAPAVLELPRDFPRPGLQRFRGDLLPVHIPVRLSDRFRALCVREGITPFMGLLAAFQLLLSRVSGQEDVCVGSPIAGRQQPGLEELIGFFVNTLVLRSRLPRTLTFRELLRQVRETTLDAYAHQDVPFEKLVEALHPPRSLSHAPLVQVVFALQEGTRRDVSPEGLALRPVELGSGTAKFDLTLSLSDTPEGLGGTLEYDADLFTSETAARLMKQLQVLLEGAVADPGQRLGELPMMDAAERQRVLVEWNDTAVDYPREACLAELFEAQAARTPDAVAVECEASRLTYGELDRRANQLAAYLRKRGVGPGTPVGLCVQRSLELVVGMLGILKAGGAYVPLDPTYPRERLAFMVEDSRLPVVLAQRSVLELLPSGSAAVLLLDEAWSEVAHESEASPQVTVPAESLAYVMYTSGSTGRPKGVCVPQRAVSRLVLGSRFARWGPEEVFLQLAPICFDAATFELWGALLHGSKLVLFPPQTPTVDSLKDVLTRHGVTTLWLTAALFEAISAARPDALDGVRQLLAGGDVLPPTVVRERLARGGVLINGYGPTEGTTFTCCHVMEGAVTDGAIPIGRPIANTRVYVVDGGLLPVPVGVPGELLIGGDGLAWGYQGRPELTAERFVPDPFGTEAGGRLYRTGDSVRYSEDGTLEFLGRLDAQVKVRGYRVEPGEVEEALRTHPAVAEAVVVARPDPAGGKRLVAYAVPRAGEMLEPRVLRAFLAEALPEFMVPSALVPLSALPLTPVGKLDRAALPEPDVARPAGSTFAEPSTALERQVAELWAKVLGVERVGVEDHFFADLGGSSMSVVKACALLRDTLKRDVPATRFFEHPTVRAFVMSLERDGESAADTQDNEAHVDRAQQRRQAIRRQGRRGNHDND